MSVPLRERKQSSLFCVQLTAEIVKRIGIFFSKPEEISTLLLFREKVANLSLDLYKTVHKVKDAFPKNPDLQMERSLKCKEAKLLIEDIFYIFELGAQVLAVQKKKEQAITIVERLEKLDQILDKIRFKCVEEVINAENKNQEKFEEKKKVASEKPRSNNSSSIDDDVPWDDENSTQQVSKSKDNLDDDELDDFNDNSSKSKKQTNSTKNDIDDWDNDF